ncbi:MAG: M28 family peptidase [Bryobacterales bacterium]|nr:M28 family peptidase [Bryobacterales bacterium]
MTRRELASLCGGVLLESRARGAGRPVLSTPEERAAYLRTMLEALCTRIGPRPSPSKGYDAGAALIEREMKRFLPRVARDSFPVTGWEAVGEAQFRVGGRPLETYIAENSPATPPDGVRGRLRKAGLYEIVEPASGEVLARAGISEFGRAIASSHSGRDKVPLFNLGRQDVELLDRAAQEGAAAEARAAVRWIHGARTGNVAGTLPGASREEILFVAHADTKYNTPGANDNAASMICLLLLAQAMPAARPRRTVTFLATAAEERGYQGAKHYAAVRREKGTLGDIKVCINLDSLTYGPNLQIATRDEALARMILDVHRDLGLQSKPKVLHQDDTMDSAPFLAAGARTVHLNSRGDDARTLPLWHRPEDRPETVKPEFIEQSFRVLMELCARLQAAERLA